MAHIPTSLLQPLLGVPCWQVQWERHTNLTMQFGTPSLAIREPHQSTATSAQIRELASYRHIALRGAWMLWITCAYWRLHLRDGQVITGASSQRQRQYGLTMLDGQYLRAISIAPRTACTTFHFDLGAEVVVRRWRHSTDDLWLLYTPDAAVLTIRSDGQWQYVHETQPPHVSEVWSPLQEVIVGAV